MKHTIIIYASQYGSTKRYAERLSAITGIKCVSRKDTENIQNYERIIYMGALFYDEDKIFHLRGSIDYSTMGLKHKLMMKFMHSRLSKMPEEELNAESKIILETYGKKVDYVDFNTLQPIVSIL